MTTFLRGGIDAIWTTNPRTRSEVAAGVDLPYGANEIVETDGVPIGPHLAPIARWIPKMALLNGVQVRTANHDTGAIQMARVKTSSTLRSPGLLDIIASHRDGQPLGTVALGSVDPLDHTVGWFGSPTAEVARDGKTLFDRLDQTESVDFELMARALKAQVEQLRSVTRDDETDATVENLQQCERLFERLPTVPPFVPVVWSNDPLQQRLAVDFQRILWTLKNDLAACVYFKIAYEWDSHFDNQRFQTQSSGRFMPLYARFLSELSSESNAFGTLAANTVIFCGSELGRFPILNSDRGKDHFPEAPYLFFGPGVHRGVFGYTGRQLEARPVSIVTGRAAGAGGHCVTLDDVGATLLALAGIDPESHGYEGRRLDFLVA
jgi:hypothetical protein